MTASLTPPDRASKILAFIDPKIDDPSFLIKGLLTGIEAISLTSDLDGVAQISSALQKRNPQTIEAIHIISHGSPGHLYLGNTILNRDTLKRYRPQLQLWQQTLSPRANILLYGCRVALASGAAFVEELSQLTRTAIAASVELTGNAIRGGNWNLDYSTGEITASIALRPEVMAAYNGILATLTVTNVLDSGEGSLREAISTATTGDTINFDPSLAGQTITLTTGQLEIDKDLIIEGLVDSETNPNITISGNNASRVIDLHRETDLTISNLIIADGNVTSTDIVTWESAGGGIRAFTDSNLTVENSHFINNVARAGAGIFSFLDTTATISNSYFEGNDATSGAALEYKEQSGGAIVAFVAKSMTVTDSEFVNNKAINGGAINNLSTPLAVENSTFNNNDSTAGGSIVGFHGHGGAIYVDGVSEFTDDDLGGNMTVSNSYFEGNKAAGQGGALDLFVYPPDEILIEDSTIINNSVIEDFEGKARGGGVMFAATDERTPGESPLTVNNTTFAFNQAEAFGGGLYVGENGSLNLTNSTFSENSAIDGENSGGGGAIAIFNKDNSSKIVNATIANNYADGWAGAIFHGDEQQITVKNTIFDNNAAGNIWNIQQQISRPLIDGGNNLQFPNKFTNDANDLNVTPTAIIADPKLGPLQEIDGVLLHPLLEGSAAIDAGSNEGVAATDGRGASFNRIVNGIADIGAYESAAIATNPTAAVNPDFNGDGKADILLRDSSGDNSIWLMDGTERLSESAIPNAASDWQVEGIADFDGDRQSDILWRDSSGNHSLWLMDGTTRQSNNSIPSAAGNWQVASVDDFNGDRKADILWRDPLTGENALWLMDGANRLSALSMTAAGSNWQLQGTGDFNDDNFADILWRDPLKGINTVWLMNGDRRIGGGTIPQTNSNWQVRGTGDFNGDNSTDILWHNPITGFRSIWLMDGRNYIGGGALPKAGSNWQVQGITDFNGDGRSDLLWRNSDGKTAIWLMDSTAIASSSFLSNTAAVDLVT